MNTPLPETGGTARAIVILCLAALGAMLTAARIHGYSFSAWHAAIDGSPPGEVLYNEPKGYRSDDWLVALPHALAQRSTTPAFPVANPLIGDGHYNMLISGAAPVRDLTVLFRPQVWGYFISGDGGMAFQWWFGALGLWMAVWLLLLRLTGNDHWIAACGATALLFSPFFQAWSLNCAPSVIFACGALLALMRLRTVGVSFHGLPIMGFTLLFAWCGAAFLMTFNYTPYLIVLLYFIIFVFAGMAFQHRSSASAADNEPDPEKALNNCAAERPRSISPRSIRWLGVSLALLFILGIGVYLAASNWATIQVIRNSDYPGQRVSNGGDQTIWHIFRGNVLSFKPPEDWGDLNPCEGAGFFMIFPLVCAAFARDWWCTRRTPAPLIFALAGYIVFLLIWNLTGFPEILARWTLISRAPPARTLIGMGIADLLLLAVYAAGRPWKQPVLRKDYISPWIVCPLWAGFHIGFAFRLIQPDAFPGYTLSAGLIGGIFSAALAPLLYMAPRLVLPAILAASILTTYDINSVARGGTVFVQDNPLSRKIRALDQEGLKQGRQPVWIVYGDMILPNLFRMLGARAINGVHAYPQLELWKTLDPEGQYRTVYNRYAHVVFDLPATAEEIDFYLVQPDLFIAFLHPENPRFDALNVNYILCLDRQTPTFDRLPTLRKVCSHAGKHIYAVKNNFSSAE